MSAIKLVPVEYEDQVEYLETGSVWLQLKYYRVVFLPGPPNFQYQNEKKLAQPTRSFLTLKISWKTSPGWLQLVFHFGTEDRAAQLKKPPCINLSPLFTKIGEVEAGKENTNDSNQ